MPALTRRRDPATRDETWLIPYDDVHVGTGTLSHLCRLQQFYWQRYKMRSPPLITVPGVQTMPLRCA